MNKNVNFFIDLLRLMPDDACVVFYSTEDEILQKVKSIAVEVKIEQAEVFVPLSRRKELIKLLVCTDILPSVIHSIIERGEATLFNSYDRMMGCYLNKPVQIPPTFIKKYSLVEYETGWEFCGDGWDGIEQYVLLL
ncbi:hypothetical protein [Hymenobacter rubripertinctus]|uniref:Uncharacterized protein n=1 Tax=Hymenobacter rubripertinctus TaxID=2029981 RepID=A0A418R6A7_9BACT|nr:hypothetical protein [Hymenobacter rubripertinctus]RIY12879.1 hypothetical protein D0T11_03905 [Hymenobacter rubripertinctus]